MISRGSTNRKGLMARSITAEMEILGRIKRFVLNAFLSLKEF